MARPGRWPRFAEGSQFFSPPSLGRQQMSSAQGQLLSVREDNGRVGFMYATSQPMAFQTSLAAGNVYATTTSGPLLSLKTNDPDPDGWYVWRGDASTIRRTEQAPISGTC